MKLTEGTGKPNIDLSSTPRPHNDCQQKQSVYDVFSLGCLRHGFTLRSHPSGVRIGPMLSDFPGPVVIFTHTTRCATRRQSQFRFASWSQQARRHKACVVPRDGHGEGNKMTHFMDIIILNLCNWCHQFEIYVSASVHVWDFVA